MEITLGKGKKNGKFTAQPTYPCFDQDLGDSEGAGNLPVQIWQVLLFFQNLGGKFVENFLSKTG